MKLFIILLLTCWSTYLKAQTVLSPYSFNKQRQTGVLASTGSPNYKFIPFRAEEELKAFYDSSKVFNAIQRVSFSDLIGGEGNNPTSFVEILTYVDPKSKFRANLSVQLTDSESSDTTTTQNIAIQKLLTNGGNISFGINRPVFYDELWDGNFILTNTYLNLYLDVPYVNKKVYNPGLGLQMGITGDFRLFTDGNTGGKLFRAGAEYGLIYNALNEPYQKNTEISELPKTISFITVEPYIGFLMFTIKYTSIISSNELFQGKKSILEIGLVPIKF